VFNYLTGLCQLPRTTISNPLLVLIENNGNYVLLICYLQYSIVLVKATTGYYMQLFKNRKEDLDILILMLF